MKALNLDKEFTPYGKGINYKSFEFAGGEPHIIINQEINANEEVMITTRVKSFNDLGKLIITVDALRRMNVSKIKLLMPYMPGARQDRLMQSGEALTVKVYSDIINNLNLQEVQIFDPHSDVTPALLNNVTVFQHLEFVKQATSHLSKFTLIAPDSGATKKVYKLSKFLGLESVVECSKIRDPKTGKLNEFKAYAEDLKNQTCVIVDDICDGGGTFIGIAKELKKKNAGKLVLVISHGIFSKGTTELSKYYNEIICSDSFNNTTNNNIKQIKLNKNLLK